MAYREVKGIFIASHSKNNGKIKVYFSFQTKTKKEKTKSKSQSISRDVFRNACAKSGGK